MQPLRGASDTPLLGRATEQRAVADAVCRGAGRGAVLALSGDPGIGKSALLRVARGLAVADGQVVLSCAGVEAEAHLPFAALHQLLEPVLHYGDLLPERHRVALLTALGQTEGAKPDLFLVAAAALEVLDRAARDRPVVALVDDVQWLDPASGECVAHLTRRIPGAAAAILLLTAARPGSPIPSDAVTELRLDGLDEDAAVALLHRSAPEVTGADLRAVLVEAQGNPLALLELPGARQGPASGSGPLRLSTRLERAFGSRVVALPARIRDLALVAAVDEGLDRREIVAAASRLSGGIGLGGTEIDGARAAGLLVEEDGELRFRHPLVRSGVLQTERLGRKQAAHAALAAVVDDPFRRAWHRAQATVGPDDAVADELAEATAAVLDRGAVMTAVLALERAARLSGTSARRGHRLLKAAEQAFGAGRADVVARLVRDAADEQLDELDRARMQWLREIFNDGRPGDASQVMRLCDAAERANAGGDPGLALDLLLGAALRCWWADTGAAARAKVVSAVASVRRPGDARSVAALAVADPLLTATDVTAALEQRPAESVDDADTLHLLGMAAHAIGDSPRSDSYLTAAELVLREHQRLGVLAQALSMHVIVLLELGDWHRAEAAGNEAIALAHETGQPVWTTGTLACEAIAQALRGRAQTALDLAVRVEIEAHPGRLSDLLSCAALARGIAHLVLDDPDRAFESLSRLFDPDAACYHRRERFGGVMFLAEAAARSGHRLEAARILERLQEVATVTPVPLLTAHLAYARAVLADDAHAESRFREAMTDEAQRWPWVLARTRLAYGDRLQRTDRTAEAIRPLEQAAQTFDDIGARHWSSAAHSLLATIRNR